MSCFMSLLSLCARLLSTLSYLAHPNCQLEAGSPGQTLDLASKRSADARQAVQAFQRIAGSPYSVLYLKAGTTGATCVVWVQRSSSRFTRYVYRAHRVDSSHVVRARLYRPLAQVPRACYSTLCESISTAPVYCVLVVKQGKKVKSGLSFVDYVAQDFTVADQTRLAPMIALMQMLDEGL
jgi:hypothetical protein